MAMLTVTPKGNFIVKLRERDHIELIIETKLDSTRRVLHINTDEEHNVTTTLVPFYKKPSITP
jgi:hypothetical protein